MSALRILLVTAVVAIAGCSGKKTPEPIAPQADGVIPQAQIDALNKAKGVENTLMQADQQRREQVDQ